MALAPEVINSVRQVIGELTEQQAQYTPGYQTVEKLSHADLQSIDASIELPTVYEAQMTNDGTRAFYRPNEGFIPMRKRIKDANQPDITSFHFALVRAKRDLFNPNDKSKVAVAEGTEKLFAFPGTI